METAILSPLVTEHILGSDKYFRLREPFVFKSAVLHNLGLKSTCEAPAGFVYDFESVPFFRGTCPEAGTSHDLLCRTDSDPQVNKSVAARVYFEILDYVYSLDDSNTIKGHIDTARESAKKWIKYGVVLVAPGYFHKHSINATYEEMAERTMV